MVLAQEGLCFSGAFSHHGTRYYLAVTEITERRPGPKTGLANEGKYIEKVQNVHNNY